MARCSYCGERGWWWKPLRPDGLCQLCFDLEGEAFQREVTAVRALQAAIEIEPGAIEKFERYSRLITALEELRTTVERGIRLSDIDPDAAIVAARTGQIAVARALVLEHQARALAVPRDNVYLARARFEEAIRIAEWVNETVFGDTVLRAVIEDLRSKQAAL